MKEHHKKRGKFIVLIIFYLILILSSYRIYEKNIITLETLSNISPIIFIILAAISTFILLPITAVSFIGGIIFGGLKGGIYSLIGITIGATLLFEISRILGRDFMSDFIKNKSKTLHNLNNKVKNHGIKTTFLLRILHVPFNLLNMVLGLSKINTKDFIIGTVLGAAPIVFFLTIIGSSAKDYNLLHMIIPIVLILILAIIFISHLYLKKSKS